jgi:hypothetical protein
MHIVIRTFLTIELQICNSYEDSYNDKQMMKLIPHGIFLPDSTLIKPFLHYFYVDRLLPCEG